MTPKRKYQLKVLGVSLLLMLSVASFTYMNSIDNLIGPEDDPVLVEERQEKNGEILPDVQLIKALMQRTFDFISVGRQF